MYKRQVLILPSDVADARMRMFNLDGSEGRMCGNAIRCVGKYLVDHGIVPKLELTVETLSGIKTLQLHKINGEVRLATVDMGPAELRPPLIPVKPVSYTHLDVYKRQFLLRRRSLLFHGSGIL